jgi:hypothetical protein
MSSAWLALHTFTTLFMCGLAWFVQVVHYPLMARVGERHWCEYERAHGTRTTWVVMPVMTLEALAALQLVWTAPGSATWAGLALVALLWLSTFLVQVPLHARLAQGFDAHLHGRLVASSWLRTGAWSARAALVVFVLRPEAT